MKISEWVPQPKQAEFIYVGATEALMGGCLGGAKTSTLSALTVLRALKHPDTCHLLMRRSMPELSRGNGLIPRTAELLAGLSDWKERKQMHYLHNGSIIEFGYCERDADLMRYDGAEYATISIDQVEEFTEYQVDYLSTRNRCSVPDVKSIRRFSANPKGVGKAWVKRRFIDPAPKGGEWEASKVITDFSTGDEKIITVSRAFVPSGLKDNKYLQNTGYEESLSWLPDDLRRKMLEGDWSINEGMYFTEFTDSHIEEYSGTYQRVVVGIDYGYAAPFAAIWCGFRPDGSVHVFKELYRPRMIEERQAEMVLDGSRGIDSITYKADPSCWNKRGETGRSPAEVWASHDLVSMRASNERVFGWNRIRSLLLHNHLTISSECPNLIRELREAVCDTNKEEDLDTYGSDHALDALRYALADARIHKADPVESEGSLFQRILAAQHGGYQEVGGWV